MMEIIFVSVFAIFTGKRNNQVKQYSIFADIIKLFLKEIYCFKRRNFLGHTCGFVVKFQESANFTGDSYLKFGQEFTLPGFACSLCLR